MLPGEKTLGSRQNWGYVKVNLTASAAKKGVGQRTKMATLGTATNTSEKKYLFFDP